MKIVFTTFLFFFFSFSTGTAQEAVFLTNPSFEGTAQYAAVPGGWKNCAFNNEAPPDIHPVKNTNVGMSVIPHHGETFLGLLSKSNSTVESIGQRLKKPLRAGVCYSFSTVLCKSEKYYVLDSKTKKAVRYDGALVLRIWGGASPCGHKSLLAVSPPIKNTDWERFDFQFRPDADLDWISFDVYYTEGAASAYRGNLMMDDASPFIPIDCRSKEPLVNTAELTVPEYKFVKYEVPSNAKEEVHWAVGDLLVEFLDFRVVEKKEDLVNLVFDNCNKVGFLFSSRELMDKRGYAIKEIAVNVQKFKDLVLVVGIPRLGQKLNKQRSKRLKRTFREIGLSKKLYRIELVDENADHSEWLCGQKELWLRLEDL
ncbi:MAG TPA: hypothetical protein ENJ95_16105 [Bacteroidetes bacterium]|nr:hypothetical protein [Bacteroidota bacterium]